MKKFENAQLEIVKLDMANIITESMGICNDNMCPTDLGAKDADWDEE